MKFKSADFFTLFYRYCEICTSKGWHENGSGGLSMLMPPELIMTLEAGLDLSGRFEPLGFKVPELSREFIMITAAGELLNDLAERPDEICGILQVGPDGASWRKVSGFNGVDPVTGRNGMVRNPSRDFQIHLMLHAERIRSGRGRLSVIYHCHPVNLTALTYLLPLEDESFSRVLFQSSVKLTEEYSQGVGVVDRLIPDVIELGKATEEKMHGRDAVVWAFHGLICSGISPIQVIGCAEAIEKAAELRLKLMAVPAGVRQEANIDDIIKK